MDEFDIFISYRRDGGSDFAGRIRDRLISSGFKVFMDVENLHTGHFNVQLLDRISNCKDFIIVLSSHALDRCNNEDDWVRNELACALRKKKHIIPILLKDFEMPYELPKDIAEIRNLQGITAPNEYFDAFFQHLKKEILSKPHAHDLINDEKNTKIIEKSEKMFNEDDETGVKIKESVINLILQLGLVVGLLSATVFLGIDFLISYWYFPVLVYSISYVATFFLLDIPLKDKKANFYFLGVLLVIIPLIITGNIPKSFISGEFSVEEFSWTSFVDYLTVIIMWVACMLNPMISSFFLSVKQLSKYKKSKIYICICWAVILLVVAIFFINMFYQRNILPIITQIGKYYQK